MNRRIIDRQPCAIVTIDCAAAADVTGSVAPAVGEGAACARSPG